MFLSQDRRLDINSSRTIPIEYGEGISGSSFTDNSYQISYPHSWKNKSIQLEYIRNGMFISLFDFTLTEAISVPVETQCTPLTFGAITSGSYEMQYRNGRGKNITQTSVPLEGIGRQNLLSGTLNMQAHKHFQMMGVSVSDECIEEILCDHEDYQYLHKKLKNNQENLQAIGTWKLSQNIQYIVSQLLYCPLQGKIKNLFLESKALEILALQLEHLQNRSSSLSSIKHSDIDKMYEARQLLFASLEEPLSIHELAQKVGINDFRLKQGFKKLFNTTVYGALREHRLETAKIRLLEGETTVTEVASSIGYTNISHFIAAFRRQYTINPGELLKKTKHHHFAQQDYKKVLPKMGQVW